MDLSTLIACVSFLYGLMIASGSLCVSQAELVALFESDAGDFVN
jgi:hypothetical protein